MRRSQQPDPTLDSNGCLDSDSDGYSDTADFYPNDATRWEEESLMIWIALAAFILISISVGLAFMKYRSGRKENLPFAHAPGMLDLSQLPPPQMVAPPAFEIQAPPPAFATTEGLPTPAPTEAPQPLPSVTDALAAMQSDAPTSSGPPVPAEGLPPGWTMEQWNWYGEEWLRNNGQS